MTIVTSWCVIAREVAEKFPLTDRAYVLSREGDLGALMGHISQTHDLTFAEAAEMVTFRISQYVEPTRLSA
ncbi:MAG: hypothetical protein LJE62_11965 [Silicimonas sp.]|jgi:hypothetical protein|nr:hypothetical protein [Silicimonas sp.]